MKYSNLAIVPLFILILTGCEPSQNPLSYEHSEGVAAAFGSDDGTVSVRGSLVLGAPTVPGASAIQGYDESVVAERRRVLSAVWDIRGPFARSGTDDATLDERELLAKQALAEAATEEPLVRWFVEQSVAGDMLGALLAAGNAVEPGRLEPFLDVLVSGGSPNAHLVADALARIAPYWEADRVAEYATLALNHADQWLENHRRAGMRATQSVNAERAVGVSPAHLIEDGAESLRAMAAR